MAMAKITGLCVGESLVGEGNEVAHIDLIMGPRGSAAETAFANALVNNKDGFTSLLAVVAPNLLTKAATVMFNKVTIRGAKQAVEMLGPAQHAVAMAVADCGELGARRREARPGARADGRARPRRPRRPRTRRRALPDELLGHEGVRRLRLPAGGRARADLPRGVGGGRGAHGVDVRCALRARLRRV